MPNYFTTLTKKKRFRFALLFLLVVGCGIILRLTGFNSSQSLAGAIFLLAILGTSFFWDFRLSFAFLGIGSLLLTRTVNLENVIKFASIEIILFLIGMMVLISFLKDSGFFGWLLARFLRMKKFTARRFFVLLLVVSALSSCAIGEVTSIVFMTAIILTIADYFKIDPIPFIIGSVMATNIGSTGTVLGNPIGILIAVKSGLTFEDFLIKAFPLMLVCLFILILLLLAWNRKILNEFDERINQASDAFRINPNPRPSAPQLKLALLTLSIALLSIALHHRLELLLNLEINTLLIAIPIIFAGVVMIWQYKKARTYIESIDWWSLLFLMLLFAQAGTLHYTGLTDRLAEKFASLAGHSPTLLLTTILWVSAFLSSMLDNVVLVSAFIPVVQKLGNIGFNQNAFWWALLFGGCLGGNITMIGSTANIVAIGFLEKEKNIKMSFIKWLKVGLVCGIGTTALVWIFILVLPCYR